MANSDSPIVTSTTLTTYPLLSRGKVRDIYTLSPTALLFIATDRTSAFDVVLANCVPSKGRLLTQISAFWFGFLAEKMSELKTHLITTELPTGLSEEERSALEGRSMQVRRLKVLPIESIVRGFIAGSAWAEYRKTGTVNGMSMPTGLRESERLKEPIWTPSTKAEAGQHDENISPDKAAEMIGAGYAEKVRQLSLKIYGIAREYAEQRGIIIADTKFEFAVDEVTDEVVLVDEVLTPDSSRFWYREKYGVGRGQESLDKQFLRDWLTKEGLKGKDGIAMTDEVVHRTRDGYVKAFEMLTGRKWE